MRTPLRYIAGVMIFSLVMSWGCRRATVLTPEVVAVTAKQLPTDPGDPAWDKVSEHVAKLVLQDLVEPRLMEASTPEVHVRAITDGTEVAFRLQWADPTINDAPGPMHFLDACAVQVPSKVEANVPAPQMGEAGKPVEIAFWRADWQASVDGREDSINALHPNASVDHYPYNAQSLEKGSEAQQEMAKRYAPASAVGNRRVGPRNTPVEDLIAEGPGTLSPAPQSLSKGRGAHGQDGWSVVIIRHLPNDWTPQTRSQIAFAVWEGNHQEAGARKMRTGWIPLLMR